ncbi:MAG: hypothetical protein JNL82_02825 [Myxococcales bacterium]|jgi:hypothetical protein|nr:hypothetical protein [Myxococcales bacterium]
MDPVFARMFYGAVPVQSSPEDMQRWSAALYKIVASDGFSAVERETLRSLGRLRGTPEELTDAALAGDPRDLSLDELLAGFRDGAPARAMLYEVMTIASADVYSQRERELVARAARLLGVDRPTFQTIEALFEAEVAMRKARAAVLFP